MKTNSKTNFWGFAAIRRSQLKRLTGQFAKTPYGLIHPGGVPYVVIAD